MWDRAILVVLGGLFGWLLGKLPDKYVYIVAGVTVLAALVMIKKL